MQIQVDSLITFSRPPTAANEDFVPVLLPQAEHVAAGWDPYEVWRTRIKAVQELHRAPRSG